MSERGKRKRKQDQAIEFCTSQTKEKKDASADHGGPENEAGGRLSGTLRRKAARSMCLCTREKRGEKGMGRSTGPKQFLLHDGGVKNGKKGKHDTTEDQSLGEGGDG